MTEIQDAIAIRDAKETIFYNFPWTADALHNLMRAEREVRIQLSTIEKESPQEQDHRVISRPESHIPRDESRNGARGGFRRDRH